MSGASTSCCNSNGLLGWSTVVPADDAAAALILLTSWCYAKISSREIIIITVINNYSIIIYTVLNNMPLLCTIYFQNLVDECRRYSKPKHCDFRARLKRPIFGVHHSQGSADISQERWDNKLPFNSLFFQQYLCQNYQNRLMCTEVIVCNVSVVLLRHSVFNLQHENSAALQQTIVWVLERLLINLQCHTFITNASKCVSACSIEFCAM